MGNIGDIEDMEDMFKKNNTLKISQSSQSSQSSQLSYGFEDKFREVVDHNPYIKKSDPIPSDETECGFEAPVPRSFLKAEQQKIDALLEFVKKLIEKIESILTNWILEKSSDLNSYADLQSVYASAKRETCKIFHRDYTKNEIYYGYSLLCKDTDTDPNSDYLMMMQTKPSRSASGVMVFAVFTHPMWRDSTNNKSDGNTDIKSDENSNMKSFSCLYDCSYCPQQPGRPRSYVDGEPGNDRALKVEYDTIKQVHVRARTYKSNGHPLDKAEVIVLGGTFHSYDEKYHEEFFRNLYYAFNTINLKDFKNKRQMLSLREEMIINTCMSDEYSKYADRSQICKVIGVTIETRPDQINKKSLRKLREYGVTRVQLGVQHTDDRLLERVNRGCTSKDSKQSIKNLKQAGFKVDIHLMPDLPKPYTEEFSRKNKKFLGKMTTNKDFFTSINKDSIDWSFDSVKADYDMFDEVFNGEDYCPDQVKIYPFQVMDWTRLKEETERGLHVSYIDNKSHDHDKNNLNLNPEDTPFVKMMVKVKSEIPPYVRINRLKRDIPDAYSLGGITDSLGRNLIKSVMDKHNLKCRCIRCNEAKKQSIDRDSVYLEIYKYRASGADEYFIYYTTYEKHVIGFIRLRLDENAGYFTKYGKDGKIRSNSLLFPEIEKCAMIRELHVYGDVMKVSNSSKSKSDSLYEKQQHTGYGMRLVANAILLAKVHGFSKISVIPGEGVKEYYKNKFGFNEVFSEKSNTNYMVLDVTNVLTMGKFLDLARTNMDNINNVTNKSESAHFFAEDLGKEADTKVDTKANDAESDKDSDKNKWYTLSEYILAIFSILFAIYLAYVLDKN